jgi:hypothetical protein
MRLGQSEDRETGASAAPGPESSNTGFRRLGGAMVGTQISDPEDMQEALSRYVCESAPQDIREAVSRFAVDVVRRYGFADTKKGTLTRASKIAHFATWSVENGLPLEVESIFTSAVIEQFALSRDLSQHGIKALRPFLRRVGEKLVPHLCPPRPPLHQRSKAATPVTEAQARSYLALGAAQGTQPQRDRLTACVCLSAGAGLSSGETPTRSRM